MKVVIRHFPLTKVWNSMFSAVQVAREHMELETGGNEIGVEKEAFAHIFKPPENFGKYLAMRCR